MAMAVLVILLAASPVVSAVEIRNGNTRQYFENNKFSCPEGRSVSTVDSELQCVHRCLRKETCRILNYKKSADGKRYDNNCEIFDYPAHEKSCTTSNEVGWTGLTFVVKATSKPKVYKSCKEIYYDMPEAANGLYDLQDGKHFCRMDNVPGCGSGGWTLALKANGNMNTFYADKPIWTTNETYNHENGSKSFYLEEAKFPAFSKTSFNSICLGMQLNGVSKWLHISLTRSSLQDTFQDGTYIPTTVGRAYWKDLIPDSSLQMNCNRQGFNVRSNSGTLFARLGIISNQENDCDTPDSFVAIGGTDKIHNCGASISLISCGNFAACYPDNGIKSTAVMSYIMVQ